MKKLFSIAIVFLALVFVGAALAQFPAPFENAKRFALMQEPKEGIYQWTAEDPDNSGLHYFISYWPENESVILAVFSEEDGSLVALVLARDLFYAQQFIVSPMGLMLIDEKELEKEKAIDLAFDFYRALVSKGLLPTLI